MVSMLAPLALVSVFATSASAVILPIQYDTAHYQHEDEIARDIVILGGGASGTYAGVCLRDMNQSVVIVEKNDYLGGHTNTYKDPASGNIVNYGVQFWHNDSITRAFFDRLDSPLAGPPTTTASNVYVDFSKSVTVDDYTVQPIGRDYIRQLERYPYLEDGFHLPNSVPDDLLLPWPEYIAKYNMSSSAHATFQAPGPAGNPLKRLSLYVFNFVNSLVIDELSGNIVHNANNDNSDIFNKAYAAMGAENVLLSSTIVNGSRTSSEGVTLVVRTPQGQKTIRAKQLVVAAPPRADNLSPLALDGHESRILEEVGGYPFYAGVVSNTGLPTNFSYNNVGKDTEFQVPELPCMIFIYPASSAPGTFYYTYSSLEPMTQAEVEKAARVSIRNIQRAMEGKGGDMTATPSFLAFADHSPFHHEQSTESIKSGFYRDMYGLQGYRSTWYIGALFVLSSSQLWNKTTALLPDIKAAAEAVALS